MQEQDAHQHRGVGWHGVVAETPGDLDAAPDHRDHGTRAHGFLDDPLDFVGAMARAHGVAEAVVGVGCADETLPSPSQGVRRRLMPGENEREQLVAQLLIGHGLAVLGRRLEEHGEDVAALAEVYHVAAGGDHLVSRPVED